MLFSSYFPYRLSHNRLAVFSGKSYLRISDKSQGLDVLHPRFSWTLKATDENKYGQKQTAYRIWVSNSRKTIDDHKGDMWDTGWVKSDRMQLIEYQGKPLLSDKNYYWKIAVKDENDNESGYSEVAE